MLITHWLRSTIDRVRRSRVARRHSRRDVRQRNAEATIATVLAEGPEPLEDRTLLARIGLWQLNGDLSNSEPGSVATLTVEGGQTVGFTTSAIGGVPADVADVPAFSNSANRMRLSHFATPNGGGVFVNEWSLVMDVNFPTFPGTGSFASLVQTAQANTNDVDMLVRPNGNVDLGAGDVAAGITANTWYRMGIVSDVVGGNVMTSLYLDGALVGTVNNGGTDGVISLAGTFHIFSDDNGNTANTLVNSVAFYDEPLDAAALASLGSAGPEGIIDTGPGGIATDLRLWVKADAGVTETGGQVSQWDDQSPEGNHLGNLFGGTNPDLIVDGINHNPAIAFPTETDRIGISNFADHPTSGYSKFMVVRLDPNTRPEHPYSYAVPGSDNEAWLQWLPDATRGLSPGVNNLANGALLNPNADDGIPHLVAWDWQASNGATSLSIDTGLSVAGTGSTSNVTAGGTLVLGEEQDTVGGGFNPVQAFTGEMAEFIIFGNVLNLAEQARIESYLAVKYGITQVGDNYVDSGGNVIWNEATNSVYHNDVAGIGRDDASQLDQSQSTSVNPDALVSIDNGGTIGTDGAFLMWGNDDGTTALGTPVSGTALDRMARIWKVQETGTIGTVTVSIPQTAFGGAPVLLRSADATFDSGDTQVALADDGSGAFEATIDFTDGEFFTFAEIPTESEVTLSAGLLRITGTASANSLEISYAGGTYTITDTMGVSIDASSIAGSTGSGTDTVTVPETGVTSLLINATDGDDTVSVSSLQPSLSGFTLTGGAGFDTAVINSAIDTGTGGISVSADTIDLASDLTTSGSGAIALSAERNVAITAGGSLTTVGGNITLDANMGGTQVSGDFVGITIDAATISSETGDIVIRGRGGAGSGNDNYGIHVRAGSLIESTGTGTDAATITLDGTGGSGSLFHTGLQLAGFSSSITSVTGDIELIGTGGTGTVSNQVGVDVREGFLVSSTGTGADAASITITGTGTTGSEFNHGVRLGNTSDAGTPKPIVSSVDGAITIDGTAGSGINSFGFLHRREAVIESTGTGLITITGNGGSGFLSFGRLGAAAGTGGLTLVSDAFDLALAGTGVIEGSGDLTIRPATAGTTIGIGGGPGTLNLDDAELATVQGGFSNVTIGDANSGTVDIDSTSFAAPVTIIGNEIHDGAGTDIDAGTNSVTLGGRVAPGQSPGIQTVTGNYVLADNATLEIEIGGTTPGTGAGFHDQVDVTGSVTIGSNVTLDLTAFGGFAPFSGQSFRIINNDGGDAVVGTFAGLPDGATINGFLGSGFNATIDYQGGTGNDVVLTLETADFIVDIATDENDGNLSPGDLSLREAVIAANANPDATLIAFDPALNGTTIVLSLVGFNENAAATGDLDITEDVTIAGNGAANTVVDAGGVGGLNDRILDVMNGAALTVDSITISGGIAGPTSGVGNRGGGIMARGGATLAILNSAISGNSGGLGGGLYLSGTAGDTAVTNSVITDNSSDGRGGGIFKNSPGLLAISGSTVSANTSVAYGGGGISHETGSLRISNSTVTGNATTNGAGGGIYASHGDVTVIGSAITGNMATGTGSYGRGGGVYSKAISLTIANSTISGNTATTQGGGVDSYDGTTTVTNSTVVENSAASGGGIAHHYGTVTLNNTIISGSAGGDLDGTFSGSNNLVQDGSGTGLTGTLTGDPRLGPLQNSGGPTQTHALLSGSPAIDAGSNAHATENGMVGGTALVSDQRGTGFDRIVNGAVDIGAFEASPPDSFVVDIATDENDGDLSPGDLSLREAIIAANADPNPSIITFDPALNGTPIVLSIAGTDEDAALDGDLDITTDVAIQGQGVANTIIDAGGATGVMERVLHVTGTGSLTLSAATVRGGNEPGISSNDLGGGIRVESGGTALIAGSTISGNDALGGGGISNAGTTTVNNSTLSGNYVRGYGAGASNYATMTITNSTISGNDSDEQGGGISNGGTTTVINTTISGNSADAAAGIFSFTGTVTVTNSTITGNTASFGSGIGGFGGTFNVNNTIVAGNPGGDLFGTFAGTNNLVQDGSGTGLTGTVVADPLLGPLQNNGGPTETHALMAGSPAIDAGDNTQAVDGSGTALAADQRGFSPRAIGGTVDIGAYESGAASDNFVVDIATDENDGNLSPGDLSLREAIIAANASPNQTTITFDPTLNGTPITLSITGAGEQAALSGDLDITTDVTITGNGSANTIIDAALLGDRVFDVQAGITVVFEGLTIRNAATPLGVSGGGIHVDRADVTVRDSAITGHTAQGGGGISVGGYGDSSRLVVENTSITGNIARSRGGGIDAAIWSGSVEITGSTIANNQATSDGGGVSFNIAQQDGSLTITNSTLSGNTSSENGGGLYTVSDNARTATVAVTGSTISGNRATEDGGGIYHWSGLGGITNATLTNSTVSGNTATQQGGGVTHFTIGGTLTSEITNTTIARNTASAGGGGGVYNRVVSGSVAVTIENSILTASTGGDLVNVGGATATGTFNLADDAAVPGHIAAVTNFDTVLRNNGGPTRTHALLAGSNAIDAGSNALLPADVQDLDGNGDSAEAIPFDQRGSGFERIKGGTVDIGAFEASAPDSYVVDIAFDENDGNLSPGDVSLREAILAANADPNPTTITFAPALNGTDILLTIAGDLEEAGSTGDLDIATSVTITGNGAANTVINAGGAGVLDDRILHVLGSGRLTLDAVTVTGGNTLLDPSSANDHSDGGGIRIDLGGTATISGTTISANISHQSGGGIASSGTLTLIDSTVDANSVSTQSGGGLSLRGTSTITGSTISGNSTNYYGGGILQGIGGSLSLNNSTISGNSSGRYGGGLHNIGGTTTVTNSTISGNSAVNSGGGVHNTRFSLGAAGSLTVTNSTIFGNSAATGGGIRNHVVFGSPSPVTLNNTIVAGSTSGGDLNGPNLSGSNNLIQDGSGTGLTNTFTGDPLLGPLQNNGGATATHAFLSSGSPAIGAGDNALAVDSGGSPLTTDQTGATRIVDGTVDIGAFEAPVALAITLNSGVLTLIDDIAGGTASNLTISHTGSQFMFSDPGLLLATGIAGATGQFTNTVMIPDTGVTGLLLDLADGDDTVTITSLPASLAGSIGITGGAGNDTVNINTNVTSAGVTIDAETLTITGAVNAGAGPIVLTTDSLDFSTGSLQSTGSLTIAPIDPARSIGIGGGVGDLEISDAELANLVGGFADITIGLNPTGTGNVDIDTAAFPDAVTIAGGDIHDHAGTDINAGANAVTLVGNTSPGQSPGVLGVIGTSTTLAGPSADVEIGGTTPGTQHDQYQITGIVTIGAGVALNVMQFGGFVPALGQMFIIIDNDGMGDAVVGEFSNLADGDTIPDLFGSGFNAQIDYQGGDGNDVVLTMILPPNVRVLGAGMNIPDGDTMPQAADDTDFGSTDTASGSVTHTFTIQNIGAGDLNLTGTPVVAITGAHATDFAVSIQPALTTLPVGMSTTFDVTFDPTAGGLRTATVSIINNTPGETPYDFAIQGTGVDAPDIAVLGNNVLIADGDTTPDPADHTDFGAVAGTDPETRTFLLRNIGTSDLTLTGGPVTITGADAANFVVTKQPATPVAAAGSDTFDIQFTANAGDFRTYTASVTIDSNDADESPFTFDLLAASTGFSVTETDGSTRVFEGGTTDTFDVVLTNMPASNVVLDITSSVPTEATVAPAMLTFTTANWNMPQTVTVTGVNDVVIDGTQTSTISVSVNDPLSDNTFDPMPDDTLIATVADDDGPGTPLGPFVNVALGGQETNHDPLFERFNRDYGMTFLNNGNVVVAWTPDNNGALTADGDSEGAFFQVFNPVGVPLNAAPIAPYNDINSAGTGDQGPIGGPLVAALSGGGFAVTWTSEGAAGDVFADVFVGVFDDTGGSVSGSVRVNDQPDTDNQRPEAILGLPGGNFVIVWREEDDFGPNEDDLFVRTYDATGTALGASVRIGGAAHDNHFQRLGEIRPLSNGGFVVSWSDDFNFMTSTHSPDGDESGQFFQIFDTTGTPTTGAVIPYDDLNPAGTGDQIFSELAELPGGGFVLTWHSEGGPGDIGEDAYMRVFDNSGNPLATSSTLLVNEGFTSRDEGPVGVLALTSGDFVVGLRTSVSVEDAWVRTYNADGTPKGLPFQLGGADHDPFLQDFGNGFSANELAPLSNGGFVALWATRDIPAASPLVDDDDWGTFFQVFDANGDPVGGPTIPYDDINPTGLGRQWRGFVTAMAGGGFAVTWNSVGGPGDIYNPNNTGNTGGGDTYTRIFDNNGVPLHVTEKVNDTEPTGTDDEQMPFFLASAPNGDYAVLFEDDNDQTNNKEDFFLRLYRGIPPLPEIDVQGNGVSIANTDATPDLADHTSFGNADISGATVTRTFTINNLGGVNLNLPGVPTVAVTGTHAADFVVTAQPASTVATGGSTTFDVRFDPSGAGLRQAMLSIDTNDADENPFTFSLSGVGVPPPTVAITRVPTDPNPTTNAFVTFDVVFSQDVVNVDPTDFVLNLTGVTANATVVVGNAGDASDATYTVTVNTIAGDGTIGLDISPTTDITDTIATPLNQTPTTDEVYTIDNTPPILLGIDRLAPVTMLTNADSVQFQLTFNEDVAGVDPADFVATGTTATITVTPIDQRVYTITLTGGDLATVTGTVGLDVGPAATITDTANNPLPIAEPAIDQTFTLDNTVPVLTTFGRDIPATSPTGADTLTFRAIFSEDVFGVDTADFMVTGTTATVTAVAMIDMQNYSITVSGGDLVYLNGTVGLDLVATHAITDEAGNALTTAEPATDQTYLVVNDVDYGDAPTAALAGGGTFVADYPVTLITDGARHAPVGPTLGINRDIETDGVPSAMADSDDNDIVPDDEDGVTFTGGTAILISAAAPGVGSVDVDLQNADPASNRLDAWIDWNRDGDWQDPGEQILTSSTLGTANGVQTVNFIIPQDTGANVELGDTYARFRLSTTGGLATTGQANDGEVEDYVVTLSAIDFGDAPAPYPVTVAEDGARHITTELTLGAARDDESDGTHSAAADADDTTGAPDDEDGVTLGAIQVGALDAIVTVNVQGGAGKLDAWIDFNGDGSWGGPGEQILDTVDAFIGTTPYTFDVPSTALAGTTYARFRLSTAGNLGVTGLAADGEVEDYQVTILAPSMSSGVFSAPKIVSTASDGPQAVSAADVDNDGDMDVLSVSSLDDRAVWHENNSTQSFIENTISATADLANDVFAADVDGDGDVDVLSASFNANKIAWYENNGAGNFTEHIISTTATGTRKVAAADMDGDGDMDVLSSSETDDTIEWYENDGAQNFTEHTISVAVDGPRGVFPADVDGDGDMDVLATSQLDDRVVWYENDGMQNFTENTINNVVDQPIDVFGADIDGDGDMDAAVVSLNDDRVAWLENDGAQNFTLRNISVGPTNGPIDVFVADVDGDNDLDILSASLFDSTLTMHRNDGTQTFTSETITTSAAFVFGIFVADVDKDGDLDVLSASRNNDTVAWYENQAPPEDFGDAPTAVLAGGGTFVSDYPVTLEDDGARHMPAGPTLGPNRDVEFGGVPSAAADSDDTDVAPDDEDGVTFPGGTITVSNSVGLTGSVDIDLQNAVATNLLDAWIDWNRDGDWLDPGEQILTSHNLGAANGIQTVNFPIPQDTGANVELGDTYTRFRLSTAGGLGTTGAAADGEVEDHRVTILVDIAAPVVTVNPATTTDDTPGLGGTVDDPNAVISVTVGGNTYVATNNGDGTWTLADNTITPALTPGLHPVTVTATDVAQNVGIDATTNELSIALFAFDFGTATSPVEAGYSQVVTSQMLPGAPVAGDFGWDNVAGIDDRDRTFIASDLQRDYHKTNNLNATFSVVLPNGDYDVTFVIGSGADPRNNIEVRLEGGLVATVATTAGQFDTQTHAVTVADGLLDLELRRMLPATSSGINALTILPATTEPKLDATDPTVFYRSGDPPTAVDPGLLVTDADDPTLTGASVSIIGGFVSADDTLDFTNQLGITGAYNAATGVLTLTGVAAVADYQTALRSVTFSSTAMAAGSRIIKFSASDATGTGFDSRSITLVPPTGANQGFDFNDTGSPTEPGFTPVLTDQLFSDPIGFGWLMDAVTNGISARDRGAPDALRQDYHKVGNGSMTFAVNLPNGIYDVTITLGSNQDPRNNVGVLLENTQVDTVSTAAGVFDTKTHRVTVSDGRLEVKLDKQGTTGIGINSLQIAEVSPAPSVDLADGPVIFESGGGAIAIDAALTVDDVDSPNLTGATVSITAGYNAATDTLLFTNQLGITGTYNGATGVLTLTGTASVADYQTALQSVQFDSTDTTGTRTIQVVVDDGTDTGSDTRDVEVTPPFTTVSYDFGTPTSNVEPGFIGVNETTAFTAALGYGWLNTTGIESRNRNAPIPLDERRDYVKLNSGSMTFAASVPNGNYDVTVTVGSSENARNNVGIFMEGTQVDTVTTTAMAFDVMTHTITIVDNRLEVKIERQGSTAAGINAMIITKL